jgi:hypothetical protein
VQRLQARLAAAVVVCEALRDYRTILDQRAKDRVRTETQSFRLVLKAHDAYLAGAKDDGAATPEEG